MTATIIGVTGLIGSHILNQLATGKNFEQVRVIVRRDLRDAPSGTDVRVISFNNEIAFRAAIKGSHTVFCAIGTTQKKTAGDKDLYRKVDYDIPVTAAKLSAEEGVQNFIFVSSVGADKFSKNFYLRLKGEVEEAVRSFPIPFIGIMRPSLLLGERKEKRAAEKISQVIMSRMSFIFSGRLKKYKPIEASTVAHAMINAANQNAKGVEIYLHDDIERLASL